MKITGKVWRFPQDDVDTDQIRRAVYSHLPLKEQAKHCLEGVDPEFASKASAGDIIIGGKNFGCGSSRPAHATVMALGIAAVVAESFGRLFYRHSVSGGLMVVPCPGIVDFVKTGDRIEIDTAEGVVRNLSDGQTMKCEPLPQFLRDMVAIGGEKAYLKARLERERQAQRA